MPARILQIGPYPPPGTGWSVRIKMLKKHLERRGHQCIVMNTNKNRKVLGQDFVPIHHALDYAVKVCRYSAGGYLIHMHINGKSTKSPILALVAEFAGLAFGRPVVLTFHAGVVQDYFPLQGKFFLDSLFRLIFRLAGKIVCNNEEVKEKIAEYGVDHDKIRPIPAFCLEYLEDKAEAPDGVAAFLAKHEQVVCSYVYMRPDFNIDFLLASLQAAANEFPALGIILIGAYKESEKLQAQLRQYRLTEQTFIAGDLDHGEFLAVLDACHAYIRTPVVDGVSSSVLEALLLGTHVIASENGSRPAHVITYRDNDTNSFLEATRTALSQPKPDNNTNGKLKTIAQQLGVRDTLAEEIDLLCRQ